jgi:hypothetical protein
MRSILREQQYKGEQHPLIYKARDINGDEHTYAMPYTECVEPTEETMLLGDPFFRRSVTYAHVCARMRTYADVCARMLTCADVCRFVILHDLVDLENKMIGIAKKNPSYKLGTLCFPHTLASVKTRRLYMCPHTTTIYVSVILLLYMCFFF